MKIAVPIEGENLKMFENAGHSPSFGIFTISGSGMFKSTKLEEIRANPRDDIDHECHTAHGDSCNHEGSDDTEHKKKHLILADALKDCDYIIVKRACKNTILGFNSENIKVQKYSGNSFDAKKIVAEVSKDL